MALILIDTNLLVLILVGAADRGLIEKHKRLKGYTASDYDLVSTIVGQYEGIVTTPHILSETSSLLRQIGNPARDHIQQTFREFILTVQEMSIRSASGSLQSDFIALGLTDSVILTACEGSFEAGDRIELLTADEPVYNRAMSLGFPAELYV